MSNTDVVRAYMQTLFSGKLHPDHLRKYLDSGFELVDPLMSARGVDDFIQQLKARGEELALQGEVREIVSEGDFVATLVAFHGPRGPITYSQWFTVCDGKITRLEVFYDPRSFIGGR